MKLVPSVYIFYRIRAQNKAVCCVAHNRVFSINLTVKRLCGKRRNKCKIKQFSENCSKCDTIFLFSFSLSPSISLTHSFGSLSVSLYKQVDLHITFAWNYKNHCSLFALVLSFLPTTLCCLENLPLLICFHHNWNCICKYGSRVAQKRGRCGRSTTRSFW